MYGAIERAFGDIEKAIDSGRIWQKGKSFIRDIVRAAKSDCQDILGHSEVVMAEYRGKVSALEDILESYTNKDNSD